MRIWEDIKEAVSDAAKTVGEKAGDAAVVARDSVGDAYRASVIYMTRPTTKELSSITGKLHDACRYGGETGIERIETILKENPNFVSEILNLTDGIKNTVLHTATKANQFEMCEYLINKLEAIDELDNINNKNTAGFTPLHLAEKANNSKIVTLLMSKGAKLFTASNPDKQTPLHLACTEGNQEAAEALLEASDKHLMNINSHDKNDKTALDLAIEHFGEDSKVVAEFREHGGKTSQEVQRELEKISKGRGRRLKPREEERTEDQPSIEQVIGQTEYELNEMETHELVEQMHEMPKTLHWETGYRHLHTEFMNRSTKAINELRESYDAGKENYEVAKTDPNIGHLETFMRYSTMKQSHTNLQKKIEESVESLKEAKVLKYKFASDGKKFLKASGISDLEDESEHIESELRSLVTDFNEASHQAFSNFNRVHEQAKLLCKQKATKRQDKKDLKKNAGDIRIELQDAAKRVSEFLDMQTYVSTNLAGAELTMQPELKKHLGEARKLDPTLRNVIKWGKAKPSIFNRLIKAITGLVTTLVNLFKSFMAKKDRHPSENVFAEDAFADLEKPKQATESSLEAPDQKPAPTVTSVSTHELAGQALRDGSIEKMRKVVEDARREKRASEGKHKEEPEAKKAKPGEEAGAAKERSQKPGSSRH